MINEHLTWMSLLPPLIAVILVLITKESVFSLLVGGFVGCLVCVNFNPIKATELLLDIISKKMSENVYIIIFLALLGSLVTVMANSGGAMAYGNWISKKIKNKTGAQLAAVLLGVVIFIDDYFNCLTIGATMGPVFDKYKVSREKLAYLIDATAAPICIIAPISSWVAVILSTLDGSGVKNSFNIFLRTIPYNFYAILTLIMVISIVLFKIDFGPMLKFERKLQTLNSSELGEADATTGEVHKNGKGRDLIVPIIVLIVASIVSLLYNGGYFSGNVSVFEAFKLTDSQKSLTYGATIALIISFCMLVFTKRLSFKVYLESVTEGVKTMVPAYMILILAWAIGGVCQKIGTGEYVKFLVQSANVPSWILAVVIFIASGFIAFSTGTAWGTFGILIPVVVGLSQGLGEEYMVIFVAATLAGAACGNHSSPISDTCILSATGARCKYIDHVFSQVPYVCVVAVVCCIAYLLINWVSSLTLVYIVAVAIMMFIVKYFSKNNKITTK